MKKNSKRLFIYEIVLSVLILFITFSISNLIFVRSMTQHQKNQALIRISEEMILISEEIKSENMDAVYNNNLDLFYDSNGIKQDNNSNYTLQIELESLDNYILYHLNLYDLDNEKLLSWDIVKVVE
jgi:hypothetical protein